MDYRRIYDGLINRAVERNWNRSTATCYVEFHHIIPKCVGGDNSTGNIVCLTSREHFIAHLLLVKIYPKEPKLLFAAHMLTCGCYKHERSGNREYQWLKERRAVAISNLLKGVPKTDKHRKNMRGKRPHVNQTGAKNNAFKGLIQTPYGVFESLRSAGEAEDTTYDVIHYRIHSNSERFSEYKRLPF